MSEEIRSYPRYAKQRIMNTPLDLETSRAIFELIEDYETEQHFSEREEVDCLCGNHGEPGKKPPKSTNKTKFFALLNASMRPPEKVKSETKAPQKRGDYTSKRTRLRNAGDT